MKLSPSQMKKHRQSLNMDQKQYGVEILELAPSSARSYVSRMETGKIPIPKKYSEMLAEIVSPDQGPKWVKGHNEDGKEIIAHLHTPRFTAEIELDHGLTEGLSYPLKKSGKRLCNFTWTGGKPSADEINELCAWAELKFNL